MGWAGDQNWEGGGGAHQFVSHDGFLKLPIVRTPDLNQLVCSCEDMAELAGRSIRGR